MKGARTGHWFCMHRFSLTSGRECLRGGVEHGRSHRQVPGRLALELVCVRAGVVHLHLPGHAATLQAGTLGVFWGGVPHARRSSLDADVMWLSIPLPRLLIFDMGRGVLHRALRGELLQTQAEGWGAALAQWISDLADGEPYVRRTVELELEARLLRFGLAFDAQRTVNAQAAPDLLYDMMVFLYENFQDDVSSLDVAAEVGVSVGRAQTQFRDYFGTGIMDFLQRLRLWHAQAQLSTSNDTVLRIALEAGFGSLPRFYAAFKETFGVAPGLYRKSVREAECWPPAPANDLMLVNGR